MTRGLIIVVTAFLCQLLVSNSQQDCPSGQQLHGYLRQVHKLLSNHETAYLKSVRSLKRKLTLLQKAQLNARNYSRNITACPEPEPLANGRMLGSVFRVGHEVHFLCSPGFELLGSETRVCLNSLRWSGQQPACTRVDTGINNDASPLVTMSSVSLPASPPPPASVSTFVRPSRCIEFMGSTHCTCEPGYSVYSQDKSLCTDIDECEVFPLTQPGRLCLHLCVNTAGGFYCDCPSGYNLSRDGRNCQDVDECANGMHNCTQEQVCVNTFGGHNCIDIVCPPFRKATYIKTSPLRCERNPCVMGDETCLQAPLSVTYHFMSVVSNMSAPRVLFRISAARILGDTIRFGLLKNRGAQQFAVQKSGRQTGQLVLMNPVQGPATLDAEVEMTELERKAQLGRYITKVRLFVSPYSF